MPVEEGMNEGPTPKPMSESLKNLKDHYKRLKGQTTPTKVRTAQL